MHLIMAVNACLARGPVTALAWIVAAEYVGMLAALAALTVMVIADSAWSAMNFHDAIAAGLVKVEQEDKSEDKTGGTGK